MQIPYRGLRKLARSQESTSFVVGIALQTRPPEEHHPSPAEAYHHPNPSREAMSPDSKTPPKAPERAQPESLRGRSLSLSLTVKDLRMSTAWYRDVIGFTVEREYERDGALRAVALKAGTVSILLNQDNGAKGWDRVKGEGFSFQITTVQDIDALADRVRTSGGRLASEPADMPWGVRMFRVQDPDGFKLTISSEK